MSYAPQSNPKRFLKALSTFCADAMAVLRRSGRPSSLSLRSTAPPISSREGRLSPAPPHPHFHYHAVPAAHYAYAYGCAGQHMLRHSDIGPVWGSCLFRTPTPYPKRSSCAGSEYIPHPRHHIHRVAPGHAALRAKLSCGIIHIVSQPFRRAPGNGQHTFEGQRLKNSSTHLERSAAGSSSGRPVVAPMSLKSAGMPFWNMSCIC